MQAGDCPLHVGVGQRAAKADALHPLLDAAHVGEVLLENRRPVQWLGIFPLGRRRLALGIKLIDRSFEDAAIRIVADCPGPSIRAPSTLLTI